MKSISRHPRMTAATIAAILLVFTFSGTSSAEIISNNTYRFDTETGELTDLNARGFLIWPGQTEVFPGVRYDQIKSVRLVVRPHPSPRHPSYSIYEQVNLGSMADVVSRRIRIDIEFTAEVSVDNLSIGIDMETDKPVRMTSVKRGLDLTNDGKPDITFNRPIEPSLVIKTGAGNDVVNLRELFARRTKYASGSVIRTFAGDDTIVGYPFNTQIVPGTGNDRVISVAKERSNDGDQIIEEGSGNDTVVIERHGDMIGHLRGGNDVVYSQGTGTIYGDEGSDRYYGGPGHDQFLGGPGTDWFWGRGGTDAMIDKIGISHVWLGRGNDYATLDWRLTRQQDIDCGPGYDKVSYVTRSRRCEHFWLPT